MKFALNLVLIGIFFLICACNDNTGSTPEQPMFERGSYPYVTEKDGTFYFMMQAPPPNTISIYTASSLDSISSAEPHMVWVGNEHGMGNIWSAELHNINDAWYIYFEADDGVSTDNHQIYVLENKSSDPLEGEWTLRGPILTNDEWNFGIHPSSIIVNGRQYLVWSGWEHRRTETETQCIFIAEMENPWTLKSERSRISIPEYEWERQWVSPDGSRPGYPIFVNENPEPFFSPDGKNVIIAYSASGVWTPYNSLGILYARADSDLLDPKSWTKIPEPKFVPETDHTTGRFGVSNVSVITTEGGKRTDIFYQSKDMTDGYEFSSIYKKQISWDENSLPVFGTPFHEGK